MGVLLNNLKQDTRYINEDVILYEPNKEQEKYIKKSLVDNAKESPENQLEVSVDLIRYILIECTSLKDDAESMSNEELANSIDDGNMKIKRLMREVEKLFEEYIEDIAYKYSQSLKQINSILNALNQNKDINTTYKKLEKIFKKYKINIDMSKFDLTDKDSVQRIVEEAINKINK